LQAEGNHDDAAFMRQYTSVFWDRISMGCEELSWLTPETTEGALFALVVAYASLTHLTQSQTRISASSAVAAGFGCSMPCGAIYLTR
jgi:hypothetical protein